MDPNLPYRTQRNCGPVPIRGQQPPTVQRSSMPLEKENSAADPLYSSRLSQLAPHLSLPASASAASPPIHSYQEGHAVLQSGIFICSFIYPGHMQGSLLNSRSRGTLHHISNVASRGNKLLDSLSSITCSSLERK